MKKILIAACIDSQSQLNDISSRLFHHFSFVSDVKFYLFKNLSFKPESTKIPDSFGDSINEQDLAKFTGKFIFRSIRKENDISAVAINANVLLVYSEVFYRQNHSLLKINNPKIYWCDPSNTRQEGSNFIQAALDCLPSSVKAIHESDSRKKFKKFSNLIANRFDESTILATGPSVEDFHKYEYENKLVIACNSTILNQDLVTCSKPKILVFADPIFHFGISRYAAEFRKICQQFLDNFKDASIIVPIKYYALLISLLPYSTKQIIGIPFTKNKPINITITEDNFYTYTTANILTLLLLPLATTFTQQVNLIGCDGRKLDDDGYFWGHGKSVQINDQMTNIQECHPGFFKIDYNEYYFQHCHMLDNFIHFANMLGKSFVHLGNTHIPALARCSINNSYIDPESLSLRFPSGTKHAFIEPDGIDKNSGHYVGWHIGLAHAFAAKGDPDPVLLTRTDSSYPSDKFEVAKIFDMRSWELQRASNSKNKDFPYNAQMQRFYNSMKQYVSEHFSLQDKHDPLHLFMYYGSVQSIKCFIQLCSDFKDKPLYFTVCLFSESVNLVESNPLKTFHPDSKVILTEAAARQPQFRIFSVTQKLSDIIYKNYEVKTSVMPHPIIIEGDTKRWLDSHFHNDRAVSKDKVTLYLPTRLGHQKSPDTLFEELHKFIINTTNVIVKFRYSFEADEFVSSITSEAIRARVELLPELSSHVQYFEELCSSDIILIPYTANGFFARTSGILYDCILARKPVVVLKGTWLADTALKLKSGFYLSSFNSQLLISAVHSILRLYSLFERTLERSSRKLQAHENFEVLCSQTFEYSINPFSDRM